MRIALDARTIYRPNRRGTGKNLIDLYNEVARLRPHWRITAYHRRGTAEDQPMPANITKPRPLEMLGDRFDAWMRLRLPLEAWRDGADVMHCPANLCPQWLTVPTIVTIHDLIPLDMPDGRDPRDLHRFEQSVATACRRAAWIVTPSKYTAVRLIDEFGADPHRITINAWAADSTMRYVSDRDCESIRRRYQLHTPFAIHFGSNPSTAPRKNTRRVLEAWATLKPVQRKNWVLLVVGLDQQRIQETKTIVERLSIQNSVRLYGFADERDLPGLLSASKMLVYPSLSEGFGLPILDAWTTNTPVLTSNVTSLPEVAGDGARMVDPYDVCAIGEGMRCIMQDTAYRRLLIENGRRRLPQYNWKATGERFVHTVEAVNNLVSDGKVAA